MKTLKVVPIRPIYGRNNGGAGETSSGVALVELVDAYVQTRLDMHEIVAGSAKTMRNSLRRFARDMPDDPIDLDRVIVTDWLAERGRSIAQGSLRSEFSTVRTFCEWLVISGHCITDPTLGIKGPKQPDYVPRALDPADVAKLLRACATAREELMIVLMVQLGLRCGEVAGLQLSDVDTTAGVVYVLGKGGQQRFIPLVDDARRTLAEYLTAFDIRHGPLFPSQRDRHRSISAGWVSELVRQIFVRAGVKKKAWDGRSGHALRHTCASDVLDEGADIRDVQEMLGHRSLTSTQVYLRRRNAQKLKKVMEGRNYRAA